MNEKIINLFWQFWNQWLKYRHVDPIVGFARLLVTLGVGLMAPGSLWWLAVALEIKPLKLPVSFTLTIGPDTITYTGLILSVIGVSLGIWGLHRIKMSRTSCLVYLRGLPGMHDQPPTQDLPPKYRYGEVTHLSLDIHNQTTERALEHIEMFGKMLDEKIMSLNIEAPVTVFAGLAPVPLLYAAGVRLSTRQNLLVMDYNRFDQKWHTLDDRDDDERLAINYPGGIIDSDVAIAMPFTIAIAESQIPLSFKNKTIWIRLDGEGPRTDALSSEVKLKIILRSLHDIIRNLRSREGYENVERIHLFIAGQASTVFKLGSEYQPNAYPEIRIYHFQGAEGRYTWGIGVRNGRFDILKELDL